jgi:hypothetical protein
MSDNNKELKIKENLKDLFDNSASYSKDTELNRNDDKNQRKLNKIKITRFAYNKMIIIAQEVSKLLNQSMEVYALCIGDEGIIEDILIPPQKVSSISIHINVSDILSLAPYIRANNLNIIGWVHSHGDMSSFFSITDDNNQITVLNDTSNYTEIDKIRVKYCFGMTVNLKEELYGIVTTQFPLGNIVHETAIFEILCKLSADWDENEIRKEISEELKEKIKKNINPYNFERESDDIRKEDSNSSDKLEEKNLLSHRDRYLIDIFLKRNNISNPKTKRLLIKFVKFNNFIKYTEKNNKDD